LRSSGTRFIFNLQISDFEFIASDAFGLFRAASRASGREVFHFKHALTRLALKTQRTNFNFECEALEIGFASQRFEGESQRLGVNGGDFADANAHAGWTRSRMFFRFRADCF
jgi:hypothetical protein